MFIGSALPAPLEAVLRSASPVSAATPVVALSAWSAFAAAADLGPTDFAADVAAGEAYCCEDSWAKRS
jgi:hypothetical protein